MVAAFLVVYMVPLDIKPVFHYCYMKKFYYDLRSENLYVCKDESHLNFREKIKKDNEENNCGDEEAENSKEAKLYEEEDSSKSKSVEK